MRILVTGASGFIGRHLVQALCARDHTVIRGVRQQTAPCDSAAPSQAGTTLLPVDFVRDLTAEIWLPRLQGIDAVINTVGILRQQGAQTFQTLHVGAPTALFDACVLAGVARVIQVSALGSDADATSGYHRSKYRADRHLASLPLAWTIVQPSLVFGTDGASARLFGSLATLPWIPLPGRGDQPMQPIHVDDVTAGITSALEDAGSVRSIVPFVGPQVLMLRDYLAEIRAGLGLRRARFVAVPATLVEAAARLGEAVPTSFLDRETLRMLFRGSVGDPAPLRALLHRDPRSARQFVTPGERAPLRAQWQLAWLLPLLRLSIAAVWIVTGVVSLGWYPVTSSYQLLERSGVPRAAAPLFLYSAATLDLVLGIATLCLPRRRALWVLQALLILLYTSIITVQMPEFWLHPYGPLLKNLPMLAAIVALHQLEQR